MSKRLLEPTSDTSNKRLKVNPEGFVSFQIVAGSYERILYGLNATYDESFSTLTLKPVFSFPAHQSCIKAAAASPPAPDSSKRWLVTGSTDDSVKVWDLVRRKEVGELAIHQAGTTQIKFIDPKLLLTTSSDSTINLLRTKDWAVLRTFKGHKGRVNDVALHPSGRIALSVGQDRTLRFWDIVGNVGNVTGKEGSSSTKLGHEADVVRWNAIGSLFAVICDKEVRLYTSSMKMLQSLEAKSRFHDIRFMTIGETEYMLLACEDAKARIYSMPLENQEPYSVQLVAELTGHTNRLKQLDVISIQMNKQNVQHCVTISTDGLIQVYSLEGFLHPNTDFQVISPTATFDTKGTRLTCVTLAGFTDVPSAETSEQEDEEDSDVDSSEYSLDEEELDALSEYEDALSDEVSGLEGIENGAADEESDQGSEGEWGGIAE